MLEGLRGEDVEPPIVLWALNKDLQWIARCQHLMRRGQSADGAMNALYVWRNRQPAMKHALSRLKPKTVRELLLSAEARRSHDQGRDPQRPVAGVRTPGGGSRRRPARERRLTLMTLSS